MTTPRATPCHSAPTCLIADDEPLIGLDLEEEIEAAGFRAQWAGSIQRALDLLDECAPDVAIIDATLRSEPTLRLALELMRRNIPFLVYSSSKVTPGLPEIGNAPRFVKSRDRDALLATLSRLATMLPQAAAALSVAVGF